MSKEIWKDVKNYEEKYKVSNQGRFKRKEYVGKLGKFKRKYKEKTLKIRLGSSGYYTVGLFDGHKLAHRLIAEAFIKNSDNKTWVNHIDGNKLNNDAINLEWTTPKENHNHARINGLYRSSEKKHSIFMSKSKNNKFAKLDEKKVLKIRELRIKGEKPKNIALIYGVGVEHIYLICSKKLWKNV